MVAALPVSIETIVAELLAQPSRAVRRRLVEISAELEPEQVNALVEALKEVVVRSLWTDTSDAEHAANLILKVARLTGNDLQVALGLRMRAQALMIGYGEYRRALRLYQRAAAIHIRHGDELGQAMIYLTSVWAMANTGQYNRALKAGEWAAHVLEEHGEWQAYATLHNNLAAILNRSYDYLRALEYIDRACKGFLAMGEAGEPFLATNEVNRILTLASLGRFTEALRAGETALALAEKYGQKIVTARAQRNLAYTHFVMGQVNRALDLFQLAHQAHQAAGQPHEAAQCELGATDCLLGLNRLADVLEKCQQILPLFSELGMRMEAAEAAHNQALAYQRMGRIEESIAALQTVRGLFTEENLAHWAAQTDTEIAQLHLRAGRSGLALPLALACVDVFSRFTMPYERAQAQLVAARAQLYQSAPEEADPLIAEALHAANEGNWPALIFQAYHLMAKCAAAVGRPEQALDDYTQAIEALERLRGEVMLEFRAGFMEDRETVYADAMSLCLALNDEPRALDFAERSRSRALLDLLAGREELSLRARQPEDIPLVNEIQQLADERQVFVRRLDCLSLEPAPLVQEEIFNLQQRVLALEKNITGLWHHLLVHNAAYSNTAAPWMQPLELSNLPLEPGTLLLSYFAVGDGLILFIVSPGSADHRGQVQAIRLPGKLSDVERLVQVLHLNLRAVPGCLREGSTAAASALEAKARELLRRLYELLFAPAAQALEAAERLVIIPHGALHYLPFHALYDGQQYLVEQYRMRILPAASFLQRPERPSIALGSPLVLGHTFQGSLPYALEEARRVAQLWGCQPVLENEATLDRLRADASCCRMLHLACHGEFRADNPLFSGLALEDGWLTTFDIYNLPLNAELVTLSACQTGRTVTGGGGELFGLMRAFLSAGAAALVLSLWQVADQSAARLMEYFYRGLAAGMEKDEALRQAELSLLHPGDTEERLFQHPYFWAPFFLVGDGGPL